MSSEQEFKCVFCSEIFSQKEDLQTHFRKHADPNFNQKKYRGRFRDDNDTSRDKSKDQVEVVECDVCPEVFSSISKAITHKHKIHPDHDTKYFCPWCGKLFTMKHLYKKHMNAAHLDREQSEDRLFHCDICDVDFFLPAAMLYHNKFYHRQDELPNLGCSKKLKMIHEEVVKIYYCPFCGEEHENKVNLHKHINEEHIGENRSPDDVFRCPLCDAIFFYLDAYELHLTYHSIEDLYTDRKALMDEITDFSLETVQPLQERVENAEPSKDPEDPTIMGIENLFELTMNDPGNNRKTKKHKKHKKSKKPAITLDEFLNMNKDVFGEGLDFQGVEEVPTQVIAKRLKTKKVVPASQIMSSDLAKLKKQGIVVKKQSTKTGNTLIKNSVAINYAGNTGSVIPQTKLDAFTSSDPVLQKLLNQGSQIKIVKKSNQDSEEYANTNTHDNEEKQKISFNNLEESNGKDSSVVNKTEEKDIETSKENFESPNTNKLRSLAESPNPEKTSLISDDINFKCLHNSNEDSNHADDVMFKDVQKNTTNSNDLTSLQNDSNTIKLTKQNLLATCKEENLNNKETNIIVTDLKNPDTYEKEENRSASGNSSLDALKHLSNLITIKSVNSNKAIPLPFHKSDHNSIKAEIPKTSLNSDNHSSNITEVKQFSNFKNLDGITIKPTSKSSTHTMINHQSTESENNHYEDNANNTWREDKNDQTKVAEEKLPPIGKTPQLYVETKRLPKTSQKESPIGVLNIDHNSQSSADLLKHLKNVTAKPINTNSQKLSNPQSSPNAVKKVTTIKTTVQKEVSEDGTEIFSIDDSDSDEGQCSTSNAVIKNESKIETNKSIFALQNANKNITIQPTAYQLTAKNDVAEHSNKMNKESESDEEFDKSGPELRPNVKESNSKFGSPKPNQKSLAINNVLKNLSRNITVRSRNSSPSQSVRSQDHNSQDSDGDPNNAEDSDSDTPLSRVKITEMDNMSDNEFPGLSESDPNVKVEHPDDSHSDNDDEPAPDDEELDDMSDFESKIAATKLQKLNSTPNSKLSKLNPDTDFSTISTDNTVKENNEHESKPADEIPTFAKNLGNQISIKQVKRPESRTANVVEQPARPMNQSTVSQKMAVASNQVNTFNKEVKTVKTFQTHTKTVIKEITTTVTKTIKTLNQTTKQEVHNVAQSSSSSMITQKIQGNHINFGQKNLQGVKVRQSAPNIRPKVRGQAPQTMRPAICAPPQPTRPAISAPVRANQLVPVRAALNRPSGPRPRIPNVINIRPSMSGQQRPQMTRPVKVSPRAVIAPKVPADPPGHFSCFKKPKESLIPEPDFSTTIKSEDESPAQFSSTVQMSKSNFSSTSKVVKGNSVVTSTNTKSEMSASLQQLSKLRGMSGLVVKTSQTQAKQTHVEEKCEMSAKRNALEAIQKLQSQGLLVKKPRLDVNEDSNHSQHGSDDMEHFSNEEFDE